MLKFDVSKSKNLVKVASKKPRLSIIYVYYNCPQEILNSINSIKSASGNLSTEIIIVDNASSLPLPDEVKLFKKVKFIINKENKGYGAGLNQGEKIAKGKYLLLVNPDTVFLKNSIKKMVEKMESDRSIGVLGPALLDSNHKIQIVGTGMPFLPQALFAFTFLNKLFPKNKISQEYFLPDFDRKKEKEIPVICGACMMIKKSLFATVGGFDERFFLYFEESDFCYRVKKTGHKVLYFPSAKIIHFIGRSTHDKVFIRKTFEESRLKFFKKYHHPMIALLGEGFIRFANKPQFNK